VRHMVTQDGTERFDFTVWRIHMRFQSGTRIWGAIAPVRLPDSGRARTIWPNAPTGQRPLDHPRLPHSA
jgi:hypothetical protein